jgi:signal transduction histidine kinase
MAMAIANQAAVAIENARLYEQAQALAVLEERQRLARELHDSVSQALYGISLGAHTARTLLERDPGKLAEPLGYVLSQAETALMEMRALIFELRPESLETEGLVAALSRQAVALHARHGIEVSAELGDEPDLPLKVKQELYRFAQEALHNTVKHARANYRETPNNERRRQRRSIPLAASFCLTK